MPLTTPFGNIVMEMNSNPCDYCVEILPNEVLGQNGLPIFSVESRYKITPDKKEPLIFPITLKCRIETDLLFDNLSELETGERYSAASMLHNGIKLCIGSYDDLDEVFEKTTGRIIDGGLILSEYTTTSIEIFVRDRNYWQYAFFCVAWTTLSSDDYTRNGENDVWLAAEPFMS